MTNAPHIAKTAQELKPCPFCSGKPRDSLLPIIYAARPPNSRKTKLSRICSKCGARGPSKVLPSEADIAWDTRTLPDAGENERELKAELAKLEKLVYVPGLWKCAKCNFNLVQANLHAHTGQVSARNEPGDKCPNCDVPLWRVTERQAGNDMADRAEEQMHRAVNAEIQRDELLTALKNIAFAKSFIVNNKPHKLVEIALAALAKITPPLKEEG